MGTNNSINVNETTPLIAEYGGTGVSSPTTNTIPIAQGSSAFSFVGPLTNGQILIGRTGNTPLPATLTGGLGIGITNGSGTITIANITGSMTWTNVTGATQALAVNNGYFASNAGGNVTFTLPATATLGDTIRIVGRINLFVVAQNSGQQIFFGNKSTTIGVTGNITSKQARDCLTLVCSVTNTEWEVTAAIGNFDVN